jgi:hypothetical protein
MRELEKTQGKDWVSTKNKRSDIPFIRTASTGGWQTQLSPGSVAEIESAWGNIMVQLGYELVSRKAESPETVYAAALPSPGERR